MTEVHPGTAELFSLNSSTTVSPNWFVVAAWLVKISAGRSATGSEEKFLFLHERTLTGCEVGRGGEVARPGGGDFVH